MDSDSQPQLKLIPKWARKNKIIPQMPDFKNNTSSIKRSGFKSKILTNRFELDSLCKGTYFRQVIEESFSYIT